MRTRKQDPDPSRATGADDRAAVNRPPAGTPGARDRSADPDSHDPRDDLGGDTGKDPDLTGKNLDREHNTLTMRGGDPAQDQGIGGEAGPSRLDASRGPTNQPHGPTPE
jgi:hypothetical protein